MSFLIFASHSTTSASPFRKQHYKYGLSRLSYPYSPEHGSVGCCFYSPQFPFSNMVANYVSCTDPLLRLDTPIEAQSPETGSFFWKTPHRHHCALRTGTARKAACVAQVLATPDSKSKNSLIHAPATPPESLKRAARARAPRRWIRRPHTIGPVPRQILVTSSPVDIESTANEIIFFWGRIIPSRDCRDPDLTSCPKSWFSGCSLGRPRGSREEGHADELTPNDKVQLTRGTQ